MKYQPQFLKTPYTTVLPTYQSFFPFAVPLPSQYVLSVKLGHCLTTWEIKHYF